MKLIKSKILNFNDEIKDLIEGHLKGLKSGTANRFIQQNPSYPEQQKIRDKQKVDAWIVEINKIYASVIEQVKRLKPHIADVTEQTVICAAYLIYGKVCQTWQAAFLLVSNGFNHDAMELARSINESLDIIKVFHLDKSKKYLNQWFSGKIIDNGTAREILSEFVINGDIPAVKDNDISPKEIMTDIYRGLSQYTHCSYAAVLESVDVFNRDFDWNKFAGFHFSANNLHQLESTMTATLITLKMTFGEIEDLEGYQATDKLLNALAGPHDEGRLSELISKMKRTSNDSNQN